MRRAHLVNFLLVSQWGVVEDKQKTIRLSVMPKVYNACQRNISKQWLVSIIFVYYLVFLIGIFFINLGLSLKGEEGRNVRRFYGCSHKGGFVWVTAKIIRKPALLARFAAPESLVFLNYDLWVAIGDDFYAQHYRRHFERRLDANRIVEMELRGIISRGCRLL